MKSINTHMVKVASLAIILNCIINANADLTFEVRYSESIQFKGSKYTQENSFDREISVEPSIKLQWYKTELDGVPILNVGLIAKNQSSNDLYIDYHVAFFDKKGKLVAVASQSSTIETTTAFGSCIIKLSEKQESSIYTCQIVVYGKTDSRTK